MTVYGKTADILEQNTRSLQHIEAAGSRMVIAIAEKVSGLPTAVASSATRRQGAFISGWFGAAERLLNTEKRVAEQRALLVQALLARRSDVHTAAT